MADLLLAITTLIDLEPPADALTAPGAAAGWDDGAARIGLHFPPGTRPALSAGDHVFAIGHFDDPAASTCTMPGFPDTRDRISDPGLSYACRGNFVVDSLTIAGR